MHRILIVEDEADLRKGLELNLRNEGYEVLTASSGDEGLKLGLEGAPHLILLDVMLPGVSGFDVCRELRTQGVDVPIIMLTARSEEIDRVVGLELGADDYVTKPFSLRELLARIRARLRRHPEAEPCAPARYRFGNVELDLEACHATRDGKPLNLTEKEYEVLRLLIRCKGEVVSRERLLNEVWGYDHYPSTRTVDNQILALRKKLEADPSHPKVILSVYGRGYKFIG